MTRHHDVSPIVERIASLYKNRNIKILEIGCGDGINLVELNKLGFKELYAIDKDPEKIKIAKEKSPTTNFSTLNALDMDFEDDFFDVIFHSLVGIFMNSDEREKLTASIFKYLKPQGYYLFEEILRDDNKKEASLKVHPYTSSELDKLTNYFEEISRENAYRIVNGRKVDGGVIFIGKKRKICSKPFI